MERIIEYYPFCALAFIAVLVMLKVRLSKYFRNAADFSLLFYSQQTVEYRRQKLMRKQNILTGIIVALLISIVMHRFNNLTPFINFSDSMHNQASK